MECWGQANVKLAESNTRGHTKVLVLLEDAELKANTVSTNLGEGPTQTEYIEKLAFCHFIVAFCLFKVTNQFFDFSVLAGVVIDSLNDTFPFRHRIVRRASFGGGRCAHKAKKRRGTLEKPRGEAELQSNAQ